MSRALNLAAVVVLVALALPSIAQQGPADAGERVRYEPSDDVTVARDVTYARYGSRELLADLYLPAKRGPDPIPGIVVIRGGGGWRVGDKDGFAAIAARLASRGLAAACIEYRVSGEATFPAAVNDTKAAVRWLRANAAAHGIDPDALGAIGGSAGAHLVALLATTHRMDELDGEGGNPGASNRIQAAVAMAVPSDLTDFADSSAASSPLRRFLGASLEEDRDLWVLASPITHVHAGAAPILLVHSDADETVPYGQSVALQEGYTETGVPAELVKIEGAPHAFWNSTRWFDDVMDRSVTFFKKHLTNR